MAVDVTLLPCQCLTQCLARLHRSTFLVITILITVCLSYTNCQDFEVPNSCSVLENDLKTCRSELVGLDEIAAYKERISELEALNVVCTDENVTDENVSIMEDLENCNKENANIQKSYNALNEYNAELSKNIAEYYLPRADSINACKVRKIELKKEIEGHVAKVDILEKEIKHNEKLQNQKDVQHKAKLESVQKEIQLTSDSKIRKLEILNKKLKTQLDEIMIQQHSNEIMIQQHSTLFSYRKLVEGTVRMWTFSKCLTLFIGDKIRTVATQRLPNVGFAMLRAKWESNIVEFWRVVQPIVERYWNVAKSHEVTKFFVDFYVKTFQPAIQHVVRETSARLVNALYVVYFYTNEYIQTANSYFSENVVSNLVTKFPELQSQIPESFADRFICFCYIFFVYRFIFRHGISILRRILYTAFLPLKFVSRIICSGRRSGSRSKKAKRHRKPFLPAAISTNATQKSKESIRESMPVDKENQATRKAKARI